MKFSAGLLARLRPGHVERSHAGEKSVNLLILHTATRQSMSDWETVKAKIEEAAPDIDVRIDSNDQPSAETYRWQMSRPSLVFSPFRLLAYRPPGGKIYAGQLIGKIAEWRRFEEAGLPFPRTVRLVPGLALPVENWGDYVVVKPVNGQRGQRIRLVASQGIAGRYAELSDNGRLRMLVQQFIDHVDEQNRPGSYRALTLFGEPLTQSERGWAAPRRPLAEIAADPDGQIASNAEELSRRKQLVKIPDVLTLSRRVAAAFPEVPCLGQDIVRDSHSGQLYILETNPSGAVWHLSSDFGKGSGADYASERYAQFDALSVAAEQLIRKTRSEASL